MRICVVLGHDPSPSETFLRAHIERIPAEVSVAHGFLPVLDGAPVRSGSFLARAARRAVRLATGRRASIEVTDGYLKAFALCQPAAVLAEYGDNAVVVREACVRARIPLIAHFHGYDASEHKCLREMVTQYPLLFRDSSAIVAVSNAMRRALISLGAPPAKVLYNPYGVDCNRFAGGSPATALPVFVAVGRFVEKKAPHTTLRAFAQAHRSCAEIRLRMIGFGPLLESSRSLAEELDIAGAVTFLGKAPPDVVQAEMRAARCFVQHSVEAANGDSEGTPVAIIEAGASGLPVISTRHAGIPDVVVEEETGLLVDEHDVDGMAQHMIRIARDPQLAARMGRAASARVRTCFSMDQSIGRLWSIISSCIERAHGIDCLNRPSAA